MRMGYIAAQEAPSHNNGLIKLHGPEAFEGMPAACVVTVSPRSCEPLRLDEFHQHRQ